MVVPKRKVGRPRKTDTPRVLSPPKSTNKVTKSGRAYKKPGPKAKPEVHLDADAQFSTPPASPERKAGKAALQRIKADTVFTEVIVKKRGPKPRTKVVVKGGDVKGESSGNKVKKVVSFDKKVLESDSVSWSRPSCVIM